MNTYRHRQPAQPREITARFNSTCKETGKPIKKGDRCLYYPDDKTVYSLDSKQAEAYRIDQFNRSWQMADADY